MIKKISKMLFIFLIACFFHPAKLQAQDIPHYTLIINQVRGAECCDAGQIDIFENQLKELNQLELKANFALRFDVLEDGNYLKLIQNNNHFSWGALLEVTPNLATAAAVNYKGNNNNWYEAQNIFLIGYTPEERYRLIDTFMAKFLAKFGHYPTFSSAWMIDNVSLRYLKEKYGVLAHQITREQFGTDSYTLYGGPMHYPYWPSNNWALIPQQNNFNMPLVLRQTIMDPVFNYGDKSNSYTSQPNDYMLRQDNIEYFKHLFLQAHQQNNAYTFALIGLENSMDKTVQAEFFKQLEFVKDWTEETTNNLVSSIKDFTQWLSQENNLNFKVYQGQAQNDASEQAWWINTDSYRARVRLSDQQLFISDLRIYDARFTDPYSQKTAGSLGWWIVPFVIDGSRFFNLDGQNISQDSLLIRNDQVKNRPEGYGQAMQLSLDKLVENLSVKKEQNNIKFYDGETLLASFNEQNFQIPNFTDQQWQNTVINSEIKGLSWPNAWSFTLNQSTFSPVVNSVNLDGIRNDWPNLLFPEVKFDILDPKQSYLHQNNRFAVAGRNPVRLVLFPKNQAGEAIFINSYPQIGVDPQVEKVTLYEQHGSNGMLFIDLENPTSQKVKLNLTLDGFNQHITIYFAPNCKINPQYCLLHPKQATWFLRSFIEDKLRLWQEQKEKEALVLD